MKKIICLSIIISMLLLTACGSDVNLYEGLDLSDYLKVGEYKGVKAEKVEVKVEKSEIGDAIVEALKAATKEVELSKGDEVKTGDTVNIDYVGKVDGKKFEGGSAKGQELSLGSGTYIDGFEEGLVGHKVGEKNIELALAFPPNYSAEELQGKDVVFTVKINSATRDEQPEYNDAFVKTLGDYKNTEEYEKAVEEQIYKKKKEEAEQNQKTEIWSQVLADTKVKQYPEDVVTHYIESFDKQIDYYADKQGIDRQDFIAKYYGVSTEKELKKQLKDYAQTLVKQEMLIEYIAEKEGISYTEEEAEKLQTDIETQGYTDETVEIETGRTMEQYVHIELLYEKVLNYLQNNADLH
ncbi:MAG: trigger factor [Clostridiales bacterium]|nr:trigger factor [Clostridiales bacterium]